MKRRDADGNQVRIGERVYPLDPETPFAFGRVDAEGVVGLDARDTGISRLAGRIVYRGGWFVENDSAGRPMLLEFPHVVRHQPIVPGGEALITGSAVVLVPGRGLTHALHVTVPADDRATAAVSPARDLRATDTDPLLHGDHLALVALGEGYLLRWPRHDENPRSYEEAGETLGVSATALRRRIEKLRDRLADRGNFIASGHHALRELVEYYIDTGHLRVEDLELLRGTGVSRREP